MDDVLFSHNKANGPGMKKTLFRRVRQVAAQGAKLLFTTAGLLKIDAN